MSASRCWELMKQRRGTCQRASGRPQAAGSRLQLEPLEERTLLDAGPAPDPFLFTPVPADAPLGVHFQSHLHLLIDGTPQPIPAGSVDGGSNTADPDWHYQFEVDPEWADSQGIDLNQILKVGNLVDEPGGPDAFGILDNPGDSPHRAVGIPTIHVEVNSWRDGSRDNPPIPRPPDWTVHNIGGCDQWDFNDAYWPYHPLLPGGHALNSTDRWLDPRGA